MDNNHRSLIHKDYIYIGIDYGKEKIGMSIGQIITMDARPLKILYRNKGNLRKQVSDTINEWSPNVIILGYPFAKKKNKIMKEIDDFHEDLKLLYGDSIDIVKFSEVLSTEESYTISKQLKNDKILKNNKKNVDDIAATLILLSWFRENMLK